MIFIWSFILLFFAIRDVKTGAFDTVFESPHEAVAVRKCLSWASNDKSQLYLYPEDFELWAVGKFDVALGEFSDFDPHMVTTFIALKASLAAKEVDNG